MLEIANKNVLAIMIIRCKIYFAFFIFVVCANHENIFTTKIYGISTNRFVMFGAAAGRVSGFNRKNGKI